MLYPSQPKNSKRKLWNATAICVCCLTISSSLISCGNSNVASAPATNTLSATSESNDVHYTVADLVDLDLSSYGIPVITKAPKGSKVMKYAASGEISVYGGKFFKITFSQMDGALDDNFTLIKEMVSDKELNPSFDKFEAEEKYSFLKKNKEGKFAFSCALQSGDKTIFIAEGMAYDISPDKFTDYSPEDVKLMYEAAKATVLK